MDSRYFGFRAMSWEGHPGRVPYHLYRQLSTVTVPVQEKMPKLRISCTLFSVSDTPEKRPWTSDTRLLKSLSLLRGCESGQGA